MRGAKQLPGFAVRSVVYKLPEILEDMNDGHNVRRTVFLQTFAFYHKKGVTTLPSVMRPLLGRALLILCSLLRTGGGFVRVSSSICGML